MALSAIFWFLIYIIKACVFWKSNLYRFWDYEPMHVPHVISNVFIWVSIISRMRWRNMFGVTGRFFKVTFLGWIRMDLSAVFFVRLFHASLSIFFFFYFLLLFFIFGKKRFYLWLNSFTSWHGYIFSVQWKSSINRISFFFPFFFPLRICKSLQRLHGLYILFNLEFNSQRINLVPANLTKEMN